MATDEVDYYETSEDAGDGEDGGIFADTEDVFERDVFADDRSVFATPQTPPVNTRAPLTSRAAEEARYEEPQAATKPRRLVAVFDKQRRPFVAVFEGSKALERWRTPTQAEVKLLNDKGRFARGGVTIGEAEGGAAEAPKTGSIVKKVAVVGVAVGVGYGLWRLYKHFRDDDKKAKVVNV